MVVNVDRIRKKESANDHYRSIDSQHREQSRHESQRPPHVEVTQANATFPFELSTENGRDQIAAEDKKDVNADEPPRKIRGHGVIEEHRADRNRPQAAKLRDVGHMP